MVQTCYANAQYTSFKMAYNLHSYTNKKTYKYGVVCLHN